MKILGAGYLFVRQARNFRCNNADGCLSTVSIKKGAVALTAP